MRAARLVIWLAAVALVTGTTASAAEANANASGAATLREKFAGKFLIGVAADGRLPEDYTDRERELMLSQFSALTPANCMKMGQVQPKQGVFDFSLADAFVDFAAANKKSICGHCLVWAKDERTPEWFFKEGQSSVTREQLFKRMQAHIAALAGRYRGKIASWDVINEVLDDGTNFLRVSQWSTIGGEEFIVKAFEYAHQADPNAQLVLNDYNIEKPAKREKLLRLVRLLKERKTPIHAVGLQGHFELDSIPYAELENTIDEIQKLGLRVIVSECDIDVIPRAKWWAEGGKYREELAKFNPYREGCPPEILQRQAEQYQKLFEIFVRHSEAIARVSFWDLHDGRSWLNTFPWERTNYPLLFDRNQKTKPAFGAVLRAK